MKWNKVVFIPVEFVYRRKTSSNLHQLEAETCFISIIKIVFIHPERWEESGSVGGACVLWAESTETLVGAADSSSVVDEVSPETNVVVVLKCQWHIQCFIKGKLHWFHTSDDTRRKDSSRKEEMKSSENIMKSLFPSDSDVFWWE